MRRFRFHLGSLVFVVLVVGVSFAALRESNEAWDSGIFTLTLVILLTSILLAVHRTEKQRAFWLGFAVFGAAYLGLCLVPLIETRLITTRALAYLDSKMPRSMPVGFEYLDYDNDGTMDLYVINNNSQPNALYLNKGNGTFRLWVRGSVGTTENFMRIGHSLFALIVAFVGGQLSRHLYGKKREPVHEPARPQGATSAVGSGDPVDI
jgi:hypothetical protein